MSVEVAFTSPDPEYDGANITWLVALLDVLPRVGEAISIAEPDPLAEDAEDHDFVVVAVDWVFNTLGDHPDGEGWALGATHVIVRME